MSANIFISFASQDRKVADTLCSALESRGFSCWISSRDIAPGDNFQSAIVRAIRGAKMMLLVFTANSNASDEMSKELALASQQKLIVVPLRVEDVAPNEAFAYEFATRQWIDFFADWEAAINQLCARIAQAMPPEAPATPATTASPSAPEPVAEARPAPSVKAPVAEPPKPEPAATAAPKTPEPQPKLDAKAAPEAKSASQVSPPPELKRAADVRPVPVPAPKAAPATKPPSVGGEPPPARKSPVKLLVGIGAAVLLVIGAIVVMPMLNGKKTGPQASIAPSAAPRAAAPTVSGAAAAQSQASASMIAADSASPQAVSAATAATDSSASAAKPHSRRTRSMRASAKTDVPY